MAPILIIFYILSAFTLSTAFLTIYSRNPIHSAIYLVLCFFSIAGHYLLFNAQFLAIVHIIVYSGAIMVLFLFTIMLMNLNKEYFGSTVRLQIDIKNEGESLIHRKEREKKEHTDLIKERIQNNPIILEAKSLFGGDLGPIDVLESNHANI